MYEFFAKRELRKQARDRAENGDDAQITLDIEAAPAQIALLQLEVGSQKKTVDVLHRIVDVMKKAAEASRKAFQKQADEPRRDIYIANVFSFFLFLTSKISRNLYTMSISYYLFS